MAGDMDEELSRAFDEYPNYELAAWLLAHGADANAVTPNGETIMQQVLRIRREGGSRRPYDESMAMLVLLLKHEVALPDAASDNNPLRLAAETGDQSTWDALCLRFSEPLVVQRAGGPLQRSPDWTPPEPLSAEKLAEYLFDACGKYNDYAMAANLILAGADAKALSPDRESMVGQAIRLRYEDRRLRITDDCLAILILLLKNGAELPAGSPDDNPVRNIIEHMDQTAWDVLRLKYSERELIRRGGWPLEPLSDLKTADTIIKVPPPEGFVPFKKGGLEGVLRLAASVTLEPGTAVFFVPAEQAELPLPKITTVAAAISRRDLLDLKGEERRRAANLSEQIHGRSYTRFFENATYTAAFPESPVPWAPRANLSEDDTQMIISMHDRLAAKELYQLVLYETRDDHTFGSLERAFGLVTAWQMTMKLANSDDEK